MRKGGAMMPEFFNRFKQQLAEFWNNLEKPQKKRLYITSAVVLAAVAASIALLARPNYVMLINGVDQKQSGEMSRILTESGIWHKFENNGSAIVINSNDNNKAQIVLAQAGYPKGGMTFEDAIKLIGIGTTESDKKHIWRQQQISDIAEKIKMLDSVEDASVNLAIPERSVFLASDGQQSKPQAIVVVKPKGNLTSQQVEGIAMIVKGSVENLDMKDISVVNSNGIVLNRASGDEFISAVNSQEEMRQKVNAELEKKVYNIFSVDRFDNFDTIRVAVSAYLDFDKEKTQSKLLKNPEGMDSGALISSENMKETLENGTATGEPGIESNPGNENSPSYQLKGEENSNYKKQHSINNYAYDETMKELEKATGMFVPEKSSMTIALWYGKMVSDDSKLSSEFIEQVKTAASKMTGIPAANIFVDKFKMAPPETVKKQTADIIKELVKDYGFFTLMLVLIIGMMLSIIPRKKPEEESVVAEMQTATAAGPRFVVPEEPAEPLPEISLEERSEIKKQIEKFVKQKPEAVAQLLRNWLSDEWDH